MRTIKALALMLAVTALLALCVFAASAEGAEIVDSGTCGSGLTWTLDSEGTLTISGEGAMSNYYSDSYDVNGDTYYHTTAPWGKHFKTMKAVVINDGVTNIGNSAFYGCSRLTSVTIPDSVTSVGNSAFYGCSSLTSVTIPDSVTSIGLSAFYNCDALESIEIPDSVTMMGTTTNSSSYGVFYDCDNLKTVTIGNGLTAINPWTFAYCEKLETVTIGDSVTSIGYYAFYYCRSLVSVTIPASVKSIGNNAFYYCNNLKKIYITDLVAWLSISGLNHLMSYDVNQKELYLNGELLTDVVIPDSVTSIRDYAFSNCTSLTSVTIPDNVTSIGNSAFSGCNSLKKIYITDLAAWLGISGLDNLMRYGPSQKELYLNGELLADVVIPDSVTSIEDYVFRGCTSITSITIPDSVTTIGAYAFSVCRSLSNVTIPDSVTSIGSSAFSGCNSLSNVTIPDSVTSIGSSAFSGCNSLSSVTIPDSVTTIGSNAFGPNNNNYYTLVLCGRDSYAASWAKSSGTPFALLKGTDEENIISETVNTKLSYTIDRSTRTLTIHNDGKMISFSSYDAPWKQYQAYVENVVIEDGCTSVSVNAFQQCYNLRTVTLPQTIETIDSSAFNSCYVLRDITIPDSVTSIGSSAFSGCSSLKSVSFGDSVTSIGASAFYNCDSLASIEIPDSVTTLGTASSSSSSNGVFYDCDNLKTVIIGNGVTAINPYAFYSCDKLESVTIGNSVTSIGYLAFYGCTALTSITMSDSVTSIGEYAFDDCIAMSSVTIGENVKSIGRNAFEECRSLTSVTIPDRVTGVGVYAFYNCTSLASVTVGEGMTTINSSMFSGCTALTDVAIGGHVKSIASGAFSTCSALEKVTLPESVTSIGDSAFSNAALRKIYIYATDCSIAANAIYYRATIYGHRGGSVEAFAEQYGFPFVSLDVGDHDHEFSEWEPHPAATCTEDGVLLRRCEICGEREEEVIPALGHDYHDTVIAPTCTVTGYTTHVCARCGNRKDDAFTDALGHDWQQGETVAPTCTAQGYTVYNCTRCDVTKTEDATDPLGHDWQAGEVVAPTCDTEGYTIYTCTRCDSQLLQDYTPRTPHVDDDDDGFCDACETLLQYRITENQTIRVAITGGQLSYIRFIPALPGIATITSVSNEDTYGYLFDANMNQIAYNDDGGNGNNFLLQRRMNAGEVYYIGVRYYNSGRSGSFEVRVDYKIDCNHETTEPIPAVEPTCEEFGYTEGVRCAICGEVLEGQTPIEPLNHDFLEVSRKEPTETETGFIKYACARCGVTMQKKLPALGHDWQLVEEAEPTCEADGYKLYNCAFDDCDETLREVIPALGHTYGEWVTTKAPTCHELGMAMSACTRCELAKAQYLPQLEHVAVTDAAVEPSCTSTGLTEGSHCILCGEILQAQKELPMLGHTEVYTDAVPATCTEDGTTAGVSCSVCGSVLSGFEKIPATGHSYMITEEIKETCVDSGYTVYTCSLCGDSYKKEYQPTGHFDKNKDDICDICGQILNCKHNWGEWAFPDGYHCDVGGEVSHTCTICGESETINVKPGEHIDLKTEKGIEPTCTEPGRTGKVYCGKCGVVLQASSEVPALGHDYENGKATGIGDGTHKIACARCGQASEPIPCIDNNKDCKCDVCWQQLAHVFTNYVSDGNATCLNDGTKTATCDICGKATDTVVDEGSRFSAPHQYVWKDLNDATCLTNGHSKGVCRLCGVETLKEIVDSALGHTGSEWLYPEGFDCNVGGNRFKRCIRCGEIIATEPIEGRAHSLISVPEVPATCTQDGHYACTMCKVCGKIFDEGEIIPRLGHNYNEADVTIVKEATCQSIGILSAKCSRCGQTITDSIPLTPHLAGSIATCVKRAVCKNCGKAFGEVDPNNHDLQKVAAVSPSCTEAGNSEYWECKDCHKFFSDANGTTEITDKTSVVIAAVETAHKKLMRTAAKAATCSATGNIEYWYCNACDNYYSDAAATQKIDQIATVVLKKPHTWGKMTLKEGSCTVGGKAEHECTVCHTKEDVTIVAGQHPKEALKTIPGKAATCTEKGKTDEIICEFCGTIIQVGTEISPLGHVFEWTELNDATCKENGHRKGVCTVCGTEVTEVIPNSSTGDHTDADNDGYCDVCGQQMTGGDHCKYCGQIHGGAFGWLTKFFHSILALFGARK